MLIASGAAGAVVGALLPIIGVLISSTAAIVSALIASGLWSPGKLGRIRAENRRLRAELKQLKGADHGDE